MSEWTFEKDRYDTEFVIHVTNGQAEALKAAIAGAMGQTNAKYGRRNNRATAASYILSEGGVIKNSDKGISVEELIQELRAFIRRTKNN